MWGKSCPYMCLLPSLFSDLSGILHSSVQLLGIMSAVSCTNFWYGQFVTQPANVEVRDLKLMAVCEIHYQGTPSNTFYQKKNKQSVTDMNRPHIELVQTSVSDKISLLLNYAVDKFYIRCNTGMLHIYVYYNSDLCFNMSKFLNQNRKE